MSTLALRHTQKKAAPEIVRFQGLWSEMGDSNSRPDGPKPMSEPSARGLAHSLALSGTPAVPLWNSIGLFISATAFGFWDLCGIEFCILKVLPTGFTSNSGCFAAESRSEIAPHKQRNKRWRDITRPLDKRKMCCGR